MDLKKQGAKTMTKNIGATDYNKNIGANIRFERQKRNLTIEELADMLGMASGFLGLIERGQRGTSLKNLHRIATFFDITLDQLITHVISDGGGVSELSEFDTKRSAAGALINSFDINELDYIIISMKALKRYNKLKFKNLNAQDEQEAYTDYDEIGNNNIKI